MPTPISRTTRHHCGTLRRFSLSLMLLAGSAIGISSPVEASDTEGNPLPLPMSSSGDPHPIPSDQEPQSSGMGDEATTTEAAAAKMEVYPAFEAEPRGTSRKGKTEVPHLQDFDPVPDHQREPVIRRLKMIERLIRDYGRAYDYRELTTQDLSTIIQALDQKRTGRTGKAAK